MYPKEKKAVLELVKTVAKGVDSCRKAHQYDARTVFTNCAEALQMITSLLTDANPEERSLKGLVDETLKNMASAGAVNNAVITSLVNALTGIKQRLSSLKCRVKVAFLPYKAAMWTSLESVWQAACADPYCDAHVVPIPYYEKDRQGNLIKLSYEGKDFPPHVPVVHYSDYNIAQTHTDIAFIHNPFDYRNTVIQVDALYFSTTLRDFGISVAYIPYYLTYAEYDEFSMYRLPGHVNTWKVFAQSEQVRQRFLEIGHPSRRVAALGSPKLDRIVRLNREKVEMPAGWGEVVKGRKVFLWNTHLINIPQNTDTWLGYFRYYFSFFQNRNDVALLWRPHPLTEAAINTYCPGLMPTYQDFIREFKSHPNTILDTGSDYMPAFCHSDAYFGDCSSLIIEYLLTGKPILTNDLSGRQLKHTFFDPSHLYYYENIPVPQFIDMVLQGEDPRKEQRMAAFHKAFGAADGEAGKRIWAHTRDAYLAEVDASSSSGQVR